ncbi:ribonuclease P protein component [Sungkyunkwania multivorans]|uniref:Ribonuclease P protein component n=1 Tax=Sungkyunkwania multivorans TaxID=1173618 RepID=A0ABW3D2A5_9FLAO
MNVGQTFSKEEKLKSKKIIGKIFAEGSSVSKYPLRLIYLETDLPKDVKIQAAVSVAKRHVKLASKRNRIKRLMREAYRKNKHLIFNNIETSYAFMFLYLGKDELSFAQLNTNMQLLLKKFLKNINDENDSQ